MSASNIKEINDFRKRVETVSSSQCESQLSSQRVNSLREEFLTRFKKGTIDKIVHSLKKEIMLHEIECLQHVVIPKKDLDTNGMVPTRSVVTNLLKQLTMYKALEEFGYFLGVTKLKTIDNGRKHDSTKYIDFLVAFNCRTLLPMKDEVMIGIVHTISRFGVFLKSGPMNIVYLSTRKMPSYYFVDEGKPFFMSNDLSRIEKGVLIRFVVFATRWSQRTRDISVLASIEGESLGPVATAGLDGFEL